MTEAVNMQRKITPTRLRRAEEVRTVYFEVVPEGMALEDALTSEFWQHVRKYLRLYDLFELVASDGSFDAVARLTYINNLTGEMRFRMMSNVTGDPAIQGYVAKKEDKFMVTHKGFGRYAVVEKMSGNMVADGLSKDMAIETQQKAELARK